jgi:hypothetical protein
MIGEVPIIFLGFQGQACDLLVILAFLVFLLFLVFLVYLVFLALILNCCHIIHAGGWRWLP